MQRLHFHQQTLTLLQHSGNVQHAQLVGALNLITFGDLRGIAAVAQILEFYALHHTPVAHIQARNHAPADPGYVARPLGGGGRGLLLLCAVGGLEERRWGGGDRLRAGQPTQEQLLAEGARQLGVKLSREDGAAFSGGDEPLAVRGIRELPSVFFRLGHLVVENGVAVREIGIAWGEKFNRSSCSYDSISWNTGFLQDD